MKPITLSLLTALLTVSAQAELKLPTIIGDNMVLQQKQTNPIWGWDTPGTEVTVQFAGQSKSAKADEKGKWTVKLDPVPAKKSGYAPASPIWASPPIRRAMQTLSSWLATCLRFVS